MSTLLAPDVRRVLDGLARRVGILERRVSGATTTAGDAFEILFSFSGELEAPSTSPPVRLSRPGILAVLAVTFGTAGSTDTTILVKRNGATVGEVTIPSGSTAYNGTVGARFAADSDQLALSISTEGTGSADMTAAARFT